MLSLNALIRGIRAIIPGGISVKDFAAVAKTNEDIAKEILSDLVKNDIGVFEKNLVKFKEGDKLKSALFALGKGAQIENVSSYLDWIDFEGLVADILNDKGFATIKNYILTKPRMEIDVIGIKHGIAVLIDCKHWKKLSRSSLEDIVTKQVTRVKHYVAKTQGGMAIPTIVTLYQENVKFIDQVPIVPISKFSSFIDELYGNLDELKSIETSSK